jgi:hypothetical protein
MQWLGNVERNVRGFWHDRAAEHMAAGKRSFTDDLMAREQDGAARAMSSRTGRDLSEFMPGGASDLGSMADVDRRRMYEQAYEQKPGLMTRMTSVLGNEVPKARFGQAMFYTGAGGALTAAGQGLWALTQHLQQGMQAQQDRDQSPLA